MADILWPSDNEWGVPTLDAGLQGQLVLPVKAWGSAARSGKHKGTWHFYVDDYRFDALWRHPHTLTATETPCIIEPNCSIYDGTPRAVALHQTYRKRWLARFAQAHGVRVLVDVNVPPAFQELNLLGVPPGWASYATRGYESRLALLEQEYAAAHRHAGRDGVTFVVFGGGKNVAELCRQRNWLHVGYDGTKKVYSGHEQGQFGGRGGLQS